MFQRGEKMRRTGKIALLILFMIVFLGFIMIMLFMNKIKNESDQLSYPEINMSEVDDGTYEGNAETTLVKVSVEVSVKQNKIENIMITRHDNGKGQKAETITNVMIEKNDYQVDGVSGATMSSDVIRAAVGNALLKGVK